MTISTLKFTPYVTTEAKNNDFFVVERSNDGIIFDPIGNIEGSGNSSQVLSYVLLDDKSFDGSAAR